MAMQPMVNSAFGNSGENLQQPTNLSPNPGELVPQADPGSFGDRVNAVAKLPPITAAPGGGTAQAEPIPGGGIAPTPSGQPDADLDQFLTQLDSGGQPQAAASGEPDETMSPMAAPEGWDSMKEQFREATTRLKNAFTVTPSESVNVLKQSKLFEDVRDHDGVIQVKRPGRKGWENFDRDKIEMLGDSLDLSRDILEGIIENGGRIGGGIVGALVGGAESGTVGAGAGTAVLPGPGTVIGGVGGAVSGGLAGFVPGAISGGAGGAVLAKNVGDAIAQHLLGIEKDPERNALTENATAAAMGAGFSWLGSRVARSMAAREAARAEAKKTMEYATQNAAEAVKDIAEIKKSGIQLKMDGGFRLDPQQLVGGGRIPELDATAKELSTEQSFRNFRRDVTNSVTHAYDSIAKALGTAAGGGANLGEDFVLTSKMARKVEGEYVDVFRQQAAEQLKGAKQPTPRFLQTVQMVNDSIKTAAHAEKQLGLTPAQAKNFMGELNVMKQFLTRTKGSMRIDSAFDWEKRLTKSINTHIDSDRGRPYAMALMDLRDAIRDDSIDAMEQAFKQAAGSKGGGAELLNAFMSQKSRYKNLMDATRMLNTTLDNEAISKNALIGKLFEGKDSYKFAKSAKTLMDMSNPKLWDNLSSEYFSKLRNDATDPLTNSVDWAGMSKKWQNMDPRTKKDLLAGAGLPIEAVNSMMNLGMRLQSTTFDALPKSPALGGVKTWIKNMAIAYGGGATARGGAAASLLDGLGKDQAVARWLQAGGLEATLREMPGMAPERAAWLRNLVANWVPRPIKAAAKAEAKTASRNRSIEAEND